MKQKGIIIEGSPGAGRKGHIDKTTGQIFEMSLEQKKSIFDYLDINEKLTFSELLKILGLKKEEGWYGNKQLTNGLKGNITKTAINQIIKENTSYQSLLSFGLTVQQKENEVYSADKKTGEIKFTNKEKVISPDFERQNLYKLWHLVYSVDDIEECASAIERNFSIDPGTALKLAKIDFKKQAFGNKSVKAMRKIIPYLQEGHQYNVACDFAGYNHSGSLTKDQNLQRILADKLTNLPKNSLRQPIVEKILNQLVNLVNAIIEKHGRPDAIRVELARELKQSKDERIDAYYANNKREKENEIIKKRLEGEFETKATRNNVIKWRLFNEIEDRNVKQNALCIYCGKTFGIADALNGSEVDIEHIIPKSKLFDDSQSNKTLSHRRCNSEKGDRTAFDYMKTKSLAEFENYKSRIDSLYKAKIIGKGKRDKLLMPSDKIPLDFIERQLRETQYISRKAKEILSTVCRDVYSTSGSVTALLRWLWGWEDVLMHLQMPKYREQGLTEWVEFEKDRQIQKKEIIKGWTKRDDHRHHAIDALTIACTQQGFIQRINTLNSEHTRNEMYGEIKNINFNGKLTLLEKYLVSHRPFSTEGVEKHISNVLVSFKAGKKVSTRGRRLVKKSGKKQVVQKGIIVPRRPLSEESVYGQVKTIDKGKPVKYLFENPHLIFKPYIKKLVEERLALHNNDCKKALASLKKGPIFLDGDKTIKLGYGSCFKDEIVFRYKIQSLFTGKEDEAKAVKVLGSIIDGKVREKIRERLYGPDNGFKTTKDVFRDLDNNPLWLNEEKKIQIKSVRCFTGLTAVVPVRKDENGKGIGFVKPGNNHHIAFYTDENGTLSEHVVTFWHGVERKKYGLPVIIQDPREIWDKILDCPDHYPEGFITKLPGDKWKYITSIQQNEMFVMGMSNDDFEKALKDKDYKPIGEHLYRVNAIAPGNYQLRHHIATRKDDKYANNEGNYVKNEMLSKKLGKLIIIQSLDSWNQRNPIKIRIDYLGNIIPCI